MGMSSDDVRVEEIRKALDGCKGAPELEGLAETAGSFYGMALDLLAAYDAMRVRAEKAGRIAALEAENGELRAFIVRNHEVSDPHEDGCWNKASADDPTEWEPYIHGNACPICRKVLGSTEERE
jgi:hypothetical protein